MSRNPMSLFRISSKGYYYKISLSVSLVTIFIITDILLSNISPASIPVDNFIHSNTGITLFILFFIISAAAQIATLNYTKKNGEKLWLSKLHLRQIHTTVMIGQFILISFIFTIIFQIVFEGHYTVILLALVTTISYALSFIVMTILAIRLFMWYLRKRDMVILIFSIGSFTAAFSAIATIGFSVFIFGMSPSHASIDTKTAFPVLIPGSTEWLLYYFNSLFSIVSFIATWLGAALLLRHYSKKFAHNTYWIIVSAPLIYFLSQFINILHFYDPVIKSGLNATFIAYQLVFSLNSTIGGILFAIVFWTASKKLEHIATLKNYLTIAGFGFFLFFASGSATVVQIPYPPYGIQMVSIVGISSYLIFFGLYSSAVVISDDVKVRQTIRNSAMEQSKLLGNISYAEMEHQITNHVVSVVKNISDKMVEESGVETNYADYDIKEQISQILEEIKKNTGASHSSNKFPT